MSKDLEKVCKSQQQIEDMSMMPMEISALHKQKQDQKQKMNNCYDNKQKYTYIIHRKILYKILQKRTMIKI